MTTVWYCLPHDKDKFINTSFPPFGAIYFLEGSRTSTMAPSEIWQHEMGHIAYYSSLISPLFINSMEHPCCFINQLLPSLLVHMKTDIPSISLHFISHCHGFSAAMHSTVSTPHCSFLCLGHESLAYEERWVFELQGYKFESEELIKTCELRQVIPRPWSPFLLTCNVRIIMLTSGSYWKTWTE